MTRQQRSLRRWQGVIQWIASTRPGARVLSHTIHHIDRLLMRVTGGKVSSSEVLAGLPTVRLTTIGAKTGKERTVPVMGIQDDERWILIASNWGTDSHPAWYHNLRANPEVELSYRGHPRRYVAREATGEERDEYWELATQWYLGFEPYQRRSSNRQIPVIVLAPADG